MRKAQSGEIAVITGASSGIGREIALILDSIGYDTVLVARRMDRLLSLSEKMKNNTTIICADLSEQDECQRVFDEVKDENVQVLINCAGFGAVGSFADLPLEREMQMIDVNIKALHILTKLFVSKFKEQNSGSIMNVASAAGLLPGGPLMATYYATKAYVCSLTESIAAELKKDRSPVTVCALCPGPVDTEFCDVAGAGFATKGITAKECAMYAVMEMQNGKTIIIPPGIMKLACKASKFVPTGITLSIVSKYQNKKLD